MKTAYKILREQQERKRPPGRRRHKQDIKRVIIKK